MLITGDAHFNQALTLSLAFGFMGYKLSFSHCLFTILCYKVVLTVKLIKKLSVSAKKQWTILSMSRSVHHTTSELHRCVLMEVWDLELSFVWLIWPKKMRKAADLTTVVPRGSERAVPLEVTEVSEVVQIHFRLFLVSWLENQRHYALSSSRRWMTLSAVSRLWVMTQSHFSRHSAPTSYSPHPSAGG